MFFLRVGLVIDYRDRCLSRIQGARSMRDVLIPALAAAVAAAVLTAALLQRKSARRKRPPVGSRVVFLDLDGVVNRTKTAAQIILVPELVARLKAIIERGGRSCTRVNTKHVQHCDCGANQKPIGAISPAQIVLSTFWRPFDDYVAYVLDRHGICGNLVVGATPGDPSVQRSTVLLQWNSSIQQNQILNFKVCTSLLNKALPWQSYI